MSRPGIDRVFERHLSALVNGGEPQILQGGRKGVEKESLRVLPHGRLAATPHPPLLGSALTSEHITTDYSEALIELVTPAFTHSWELLQYLLDLHQFVYRHLGDELLWATSMPCANEPYATSLRMSDVGYRNRNQAGLAVSVNSLEEYVRDLQRAISTPHPPYEALGVKVNGEYRQLNANILQIENEYYSFIRPKRVARSGERPTKALRRAGVEYVEVRALDVSAFDPVGVNQNKLRFLEAFLALCVLTRCAPMADSGQSAMDENHLSVARRGREPGLVLWREGYDVPLREWARELLDSMVGICEILDRGDAARPHSHALAAQVGNV